jgi:hypothetical protein
MRKIIGKHIRDLFGGFILGLSLLDLFEAYVCWISFRETNIRHKAVSYGPITYITNKRHITNVTNIYI